MLRLSILFLSLEMISCNSGMDNRPKEITSKRDTSKQTRTPQQGDSDNWINNFRNFRDAVYQNDRAKVKQFFDFPIMNENNEIWYLVYDGNDTTLHLLPAKIKPFTEADFDKYYDKIFSRIFIKGILKIKTEELNKKGEFETIELKDGNTSYKVYATVEKAQNTLELNLACNTPVKAIDGNGQEVEDPGEYNVMYYFSILNNTQLKFKGIRLAG